MAEETETQTAEEEESAPAEKKAKASKGGKTNVANKVEQVFDLIKEMTVLELRDLNKRVEDEFGVTAAAPVAIAAGPAAPAGAAPGGAAAPAVEEQTEFTVLLKDIGANKINVIKAVREVTTLGLKEAKDLVESAPVAVKEDVAKEEAENVRKKLVEAGATAELQ